MEWFFSTHLGVMAAITSFLLADFWLNSKDFISDHHQKLPGYDQYGL
jgi:hypothetical protein